MLESDLAVELEKALPSGHRFVFHHISSTPTTCPSLYAAPLTQRPQKTYVESHFLKLSWKDSSDPTRSNLIALFAIEVLIFTTATLTTIFVSKVDSTGYLSLLHLPRSSSSPLRSISSLFVTHLVHQRHRPDRKLVVSLFARAQDQYLFPGSVENRTKHVLTDRQLVKWWCKTLDPLLRRYPQPSSKDNGEVCSKGYLIVPGHDGYETAAFFPLNARLDPKGEQRWTTGHPLRDISPYPNAPPRNQIPHFPDDPKNRFLMDLDEELLDVPASQQHKGESPSKRGKGHWKSVRTLEQFWEMMAFRQECASGRLVSFLWIVFTPQALERSMSLDFAAAVLPTPDSSQRVQTPVIEEPEKDEAEDHSRPASKKPNKFRGRLSIPSRRRQSKPGRRLTGPIIPRAPRIKSATALKASSIPESTRYFHWPLSTRGALVLSHSSFNRVTDMLLRLDFANADIARTSTKKWIDEVAIVAGQAGQAWGVEVVGTLDMTAAVATSGKDGGIVNTLTVKKRKRNEPPEGGDAPPKPSLQLDGVPSGVNALDEIARKHPKSSSERVKSVDIAADSVAYGAASSSVNVLGGSLLRKKPKI